jgi:TatD DNase family protein
MIYVIDTHAHINSKSIPGRVEEEIIRINNLSLEAIINVGMDLDTSIEVVNIANNNDKFYASIGVHPFSNDSTDDLIKLYRDNNHDKIVAIGETGIDIKASIFRQQKKFIESIEIANFLKLPVIIHANGTNAMVIEILKKYRPLYGFVFHCFQPDLQILKEIIDMGGYISVGPLITKPTAKKSLEVLEEVPIDKLLLETDYPYMIVNGDSDGRNVFNTVGIIKGMSYQELVEKINNNTKTLFYKMK